SSAATNASSASMSSSNSNWPASTPTRGFRACWLTSMAVLRAARSTRPSASSSLAPGTSDPGEPLICPLSGRPFVVGAITESLQQEVEMKYALLIYSKPGSHEELPTEESESVFGEYIALTEDPRCVTSAQLQPIETATTVRVQDGTTLTTDGPFADTK